MRTATYDAADFATDAAISSQQGTSNVPLTRGRAVTLRRRKCVDAICPMLSPSPQQPHLILLSFPVKSFWINLAIMRPGGLRAGAEGVGRGPVRPLEGGDGVVEVRPPSPGEVELA